MPHIESADMTISGLPTEAPVYAILGVCRSATTAVEKLLAVADITAYHQIIKSSLLSGVANVDINDYAPAPPRPDQPIAIKETIGAYSQATATFRPSDILLKSMEPERLQTVFTVKEPFHNFLSWMDMAAMAPPKSRLPLSAEELLTNYILSSQTVFSMFEDSRRRAGKTTVFSYDSLRGGNRLAATHYLLEQLGIDASLYNSQAWSAVGDVRSEQSGIVHVNANRTDRLHERLDASGDFQYYPPKTELLSPDASRDVQDQLQRAGLYKNYVELQYHAYVQP